MGTGIGEYCKRCGEQLNYDDGFENGFCNRCYHIAEFESERESFPVGFTKEELERILKRVNEYDKDSYEDELDREIVEKIEGII